MFCPNCGKEIKDGDLFCGECGFKIDDSNVEIESNERNKSSKERKKLNPVIPIVVALLVIVVLVIVFIMRKPTTMLDNKITPDNIPIIDDQYDNSNSNEQLNEDDIYKLPMDMKLGSMRTISEYSVDTTIDYMDTVTFGHYEIDGELGNGFEDIEWILLDRQGNSALLMSKNIIENSNFNLGSTDSTWNNSELRRFINEDCYNAWFDEDEKARILTTNVMTKDSIGNNISSADKIYILDEDECRKYFGYEDTNGHNKRIATHITPYLKATRKNITIESKEVWYKGNSSFWLRDAATTPQNVKYVGLAGKLHPEGDTVLENDGIRPVLWVTY